MGEKTARFPQTDGLGDPQDAAWAIHHCLKYMSRDALDLGMSQTANLLDMVAHLAIDEARGLRIRN